AVASKGSQRRNEFARQLKRRGRAGQGSLAMCSTALRACRLRPGNKARGRAPHRGDECAVVLEDSHALIVFGRETNAQQPIIRLQRDGSASAIGRERVCKRGAGKSIPSGRQLPRIAMVGRQHCEHSIASRRSPVLPYSYCCAKREYLTTLWTGFGTLIPS